MFDSPIIDFCIGMSFFYVTLTLICTAINEYLMDKAYQIRQRTLLEGVSGLFYDVHNVVDFYSHALIRGLYRDEQQPDLSRITTGASNQPAPGPLMKNSIAECVRPFEGILKNLPCYIPSRTFATVLLDILAQEGKAGKAQNCPELKQAILECKNERIKEALLPLIDAAQGNVEKARQNIENWFVDTMDRVSGWFKRRSKW